MRYVFVGIGVLIAAFGVFVEFVAVLAGHPTELLQQAVVIAGSGGVTIGLALAA